MEKEFFEIETTVELPFRSDYKHTTFCCNLCRMLGAHAPSVMMSVEGGPFVDAKSILGLMSIATANGRTLIFRIKGENLLDVRALVDELKSLKNLD